MHPTAKRPAHALPLILALSFTLGCQSVDPRNAWPIPSEDWGDLNAEVSPSLEQIFQGAPLTGKAPSVAAISADGLWLLTRWGETPADEEKEQPMADLRLVSTSATSPGNGRVINECLGLPAEQLDLRGPWTWSLEGSLLAVARGRDIYLFDPSSADRIHFLAGPDKPSVEETPGADAETEPADTEQAADKPKLVPFKIQSLAFAPDGKTLRAFINDHLFVFPIGSLPQEQPLALADGQCVSADIESKRRFSWSDDLQVVFGNDPYPMPPREAELEQAGAEETAQEGEALEQSESLPSTQIWHVTKQQGVELEGMGDLRWLESTSLSRDGRFVFGASYDRRAEPERVHVPNYLSERVSTRRGRRLLAEDGPSYFDLFIWNTETGQRENVLPEELRRDWEAAAPKANEGKRQQGGHWFRRIGWAPQKSAAAPARYAFELQSSDYHDLQLFVWSEGVCTQVWQDHDERWLGGPARYTRWSADGARLLVGSEWGSPRAQQMAEQDPQADIISSTPGRCQLFSVNPLTGQSRQLTYFAGELARFYPLPDGGVVVSGSESDAAQRVLGVISPEDVLADAPEGPLMAALPSGWNDGVRSSRDGARLVFSHAELMQPSELWSSTSSGAHQITAATPASFNEFDWIKPERLMLSAEDGSQVWAHVYLPEGMQLERATGPPRAAIVFVHGAGYLQNVTDSMTNYEPNMLFHSRLAQLGYPVIDVDYRGSKGYGSRFRSDVQYHLGGLDLDDIHLVVDELVQRGLVDGERVGLYGGSYGGFLTMMALFTAPERWAVGAALRSVTDWRTYHPTYTQPRLGRPSTHPEAYAKSSPIDLYSKLDDPLLILHGMMDDNVFAQDSIRLIEALIDQGSDFEAMLYPSQRHAFTDGNHWLDEYRRIERFLLRHLGSPIKAQGSL